MKKPTKSFEIALSALACTAAALCLTVGSYVDFLLGAGYILAVFSLMIPLSKEFWAGSLLAAVGASLLAFLFYGFSIFTIAPFLMFFGLHPSINFLQKKYIKKAWLHVVCFFVKAVWFDLVMWFSWRFLLVELFGLSEASWYPFVERYFFAVLFVGGTLVFACYDYAIFLGQHAMNALVKRIRR